MWPAEEQTEGGRAAQLWHPASTGRLLLDHMVGQEQQEGSTVPQTVVSSNCTRRAETKPVDPDPPMLRAWGSPGYPRFTETETKEPQLSEHRLRLVLGTFSI